MYHQEHKIAQAEHAAFLERFNRPPLEGVTVRVPNIFDRIFEALKGLFTGHRPVEIQTAPMRRVSAR
ncbi:MAG TPA: hypothetical protein VGK81_02985 [Anaerolineae bacterium]